MTTPLTLTQERPRVLGIRVSALVETVIGLIALLLIDQFFAQGNRFWDINPHPFWIVVLLAAVQYGTAEGLLAALFASAVLLIGNVPEQGSDITHSEWLFQLAVNPVLWIVAGWLIGETRQRHVRERAALVREIEESHQREDLIASSYTFVKHRKEALEIQVSGQLLSAIEAYRSAKSVETLDPKSVMQGVERLVSSILGAQKFSLYLFHDNKLTATILHGWAAADRYLQEIDSYSPLYQAIVGQREMLVVANEEHEATLDNQGLLAGPILDPDNGRVVGMLKVEQLDFTSLSLQTVETFRALSEWIGTALVNARNYQTVKADAIVNPDRNMLSYSYFRRQSDYMTKLAKRGNFHLSMLVIKLNDARNLSDADRITIARQIGESVKSVLRSVDLAFDYQTDGEEYSVLLPSTSLSGAGIVRDKIAKDMERHLRGKGNASFNYVVSALHEVR
jgi:hypothetical protein